MISPTSAARMRAHSSFDLLWKFGLMSRTEAYAWLAKVMGLSKERGHIVHMDIWQCNELIKHLEAYWEERREAP